ncbi:N-acetylglucosamine-6-phosphate deacetylase [Paenibacillus methanolicus]|uniref:N-acetylglucosamine-6-phosphate deacetylase n=1 Tax=Paenibacillus methanolicus TaxID=582686 RepID=A0A5S5CHY1_9BACL|nr:amidohydrolase family protein [Paenibacillus methanolicus]TYP79399.1 N-acetylglucosamine-6-phosphate deacetylase [Paenibacillus methanolicus]
MSHARASIAGLHYKTGKPIQIDMMNGIIKRVELLTDRAMGGGTDHLPWIGPGWVDLQVNGFSGIDLNAPSLTTEHVHELTRKLWAEGTTTFYPTVITNSDENIEALVRTIAQACAMEEMTAASIAGIHLEGPFLSPEDGPRGAHGRAFVKPPDWELFERWQYAAEGRIRLITLSPEWEGARAFIDQCVRNGVSVSIGHTSATPEQIRAAVQSGASLSTHLGNGAHLKLPRHPNYIWEQLAQDGLSTCIIADGFHLPDSVMKVMMKVKADRLYLVSDAVYLCGMEPGVYDTHIGGQVVLTAEGRLHLANEPGLLAGSAQMLKAGIEHLVESGLSDSATAWDMASVQPAAYMGLTAGEGLAPGAPADLISFSWKRDSRLELHNVYKYGHLSIRLTEPT